MQTTVLAVEIHKAENAIRHAHKEAVEKFATSHNPSVFKGQPQDGDSVFIISVDNPDKGTTAGLVFASTIRLAARRIAEKTHRVASMSEIREAQEREQANYDKLRIGEEVRARRKAGMAGQSQALPQINVVIDGSSIPSRVEAVAPVGAPVNENESAKGRREVK